MTSIRAKTSLLSILGIFVAGNAVAADGDTRAVVETTIQGILVDSASFHGSIVRLRGQFDECSGVTCSFCPEHITTESYDFDECLQLAFWPTYEPSDFDVYLGILKKEQYRYSVATIEAEFSYICLDASGLLCTGSFPNLYDVEVLDLHERRTVLDGLIGWGGGDPLRPAPSVTRDAMREAFIEATTHACVGSLDERCEVFEVVLNESAIERKRRGDSFVIDGIACVCRERDCAGRWPTRYVIGMNSPANPFECWGMQNRDGRWHLVIDGI